MGVTRQRRGCDLNRGPSAPESSALTTRLPSHQSDPYDPQHYLYSVYMLGSPFRQPLSRSSLVFLLVFGPLFHTPCISSPNHHLLSIYRPTLTSGCAARPVTMSINHITGGGGGLGSESAGTTRYSSCSFVDFSRLPIMETSRMAQHC